MDWMDANQLGRRNLMPDAFTLLLGRRYNRAKKKANDGGKGTPKATAKTDNAQPETQPELKIAAEPETTVHQSDARLERTSAQIASQHGVSRATVERAGQFAAAVDKLGLGAEVVSRNECSEARVLCRSGFQRNFHSARGLHLEDTCGIGYSNFEGNSSLELRARLVGPLTKNANAKKVKPVSVPFRFTKKLPRRPRASTQTKPALSA